MPLNVPGGVNVTPFDVDPDQGSKFLQAMIEGSQAKMQERRDALQKKIAEHAMAEQDLNTVMSIFGKKAAAAKATGAGLVPPGTQPQQTSADMLTGEIGKMLGTGQTPGTDPLAGRAALGLSTLSGQEQQDIERIKGGTQLGTAQVTSFLLQQQGLYGGLSPEQQALLPNVVKNMVGSGKTLEQQRIDIEKKRVGADEKAAKNKVIEYLSGGFQPAEGVSQTDFEDAHKQLVNAMLNGLPIDPSVLSKVQPTESWTKMAIANATKMNAEDVRTLETLKLYGALWKESGGKLPPEAQAKAAALLSSMLDRATPKKAPTAPGAPSPTTVPPDLVGKLLDGADTMLDFVNNATKYLPGFEQISPFGGAGMQGFGKTFSPKDDSRIQATVSRLKNAKLQMTEGDFAEMTATLRAVAAGTVPGVTLDQAIAAIESKYQEKLGGE